MANKLWRGGGVWKLLTFQPPCIMIVLHRILSVVIIIRIIFLYSCLIPVCLRLIIGSVRVSFKKGFFTGKTDDIGSGKYIFIICECVIFLDGKLALINCPIPIITEIKECPLPHKHTGLRTIRSFSFMCVVSKILKVKTL